LRSADAEAAIWTQQFGMTETNCHGVPPPPAPLLQDRDDWHAGCYNNLVRPTIFLLLGLATIVGCSEFTPLAQERPGSEEEGFTRNESDPSEPGRCTSYDNVDGLRCSDCGFGPVCGEVSIASCQSRDNGRTCQTCTTGEGEVVYDTCLSNVSTIQNVRCEVASSGFGELEDVQVQCTNCYGDDGFLVSSTCRPASESCSSYSVGSSQCEECTRDGAVVFTSCAVNDEPRLCTAYGNEYGSCVECVNNNDELVVQTCTPTEAPATSCTEVVTADGQACQTCTSGGGELVSFTCTDLDAAAKTCSILEFSQQICLVCEAAGRPIAVLCQRTSCEQQECSVDAQCGLGEVCTNFVCTQSSGYGDEDGDGVVDAPPPSAPELDEACAQPPVCSMSINEEGQFCRTCPRDDGVEETACAHRSPLSCEVVSAERAGITGDVDAVGALCQVCSDQQTLNQVWSDCTADDGNTPAPPCLHLEVENCDVCFDWMSGEAIYSSCAEEICYNASQFELENDDQPLLLNDVQAVVECVTCDERSSGVAEARCYLVNACTSADAAVEPEAGMEVWVADSCDNAVPFTLAPKECGNSWDQASPWSSVDEELAGIMAMGLANDIVIVQAEQSGSRAGCTLCDCDRGDVLTLWVDPSMIEQATRLFGTSP
jgi:hypothetical protein